MDYFILNLMGIIGAFLMGALFVLALSIAKAFNRWVKSEEYNQEAHEYREDEERSRRHIAETERMAGRLAFDIEGGLRAMMKEAKEAIMEARARTQADDEFTYERATRNKKTKTEEKVSAEKDLREVDAEGGAPAKLYARTIDSSAKDASAIAGSVQ